jgi:hypothetical protein
VASDSGFENTNRNGGSQNSVLLNLSNAESIDSNGKPTTSKTVPIPRIFQFDDEPFDVNHLNRWARNGPWNGSQYSEGMQAGPEFESWFLQHYNNSGFWCYVFDVWISGNFQFDDLLIADGVATIRSTGDSKTLDQWLPINKVRFHLFESKDPNLIGGGGYAVFINGQQVFASGSLVRRNIEPLDKVTIHHASSPYIDWSGNGSGCVDPFVWPYFTCGGTSIRFSVSTENEGDFEQVVNINAGGSANDLIPFYFNSEATLANLSGGGFFQNRLNLRISDSSVQILLLDFSPVGPGPSSRTMAWQSSLAFPDSYAGWPSNRFEFDNDNLSDYPYGQTSSNLNPFLDHPVWGRIENCVIEMICPSGPDDPLNLDR